MSKFDGGTKSHVHSLFHVIFVPSFLVSLPLGVMLRMHRSTTMNLEIASQILKKRTEKVRRVRVN